MHKAQQIPGNTSSNTSIEFDANNASSDGFKFQAKLKGGTTPGDYQGVAAYAQLITNLTNTADAIH